MKFLSRLGNAVQTGISKVTEASKKIGNITGMVSGAVLSILGAATIPTAEAATHDTHSAHVSTSMSETTSYTVVSNDTMYNIAMNHNMHLGELLALNPQIQGPKFIIFPGDQITVTFTKGNKKSVVQVKTPEIQETGINIGGKSPEQRAAMYVIMKYQGYKGTTLGVQASLKALGYVGVDGTSLKLDGLVGENTEHALKQAQSDINTWYADHIKSVQLDTMNTPEQVKLLQEALDSLGFRGKTGTKLLKDGIRGENTDFAFLEALSMMGEHNSTSVRLATMLANRGNHPFVEGKGQCGANVRAALNKMGITNIPNSGMHGYVWDAFLSTHPDFEKVAISDPKDAEAGAIIVFDRGVNGGTHARKLYGDVNVVVAEDKFFSGTILNYPGGSINANETKDSGFTGYAYYLKSNTKIWNSEMAYKQSETTPVFAQAPEAPVIKETPVVVTQQVAVNDNQENGEKISLNTLGTNVPFVVANFRESSLNDNAPSIVTRETLRNMVGIFDLDGENIDRFTGVLEAKIKNIVNTPEGILTLNIEVQKMALKRAKNPESIMKITRNITALTALYNKTYGIERAA